MVTRAFIVPVMSEPIAYTIKQAAAASNLPEQEIWRAITAQKLRAHMAGPHVVITRTELQRYVGSLPSPLDGFDTSEVRRQAKIQLENEKRARGRAIAEQAMGRGPKSQPMSAAEREKAHSDRVAQERAKMQRGRDLVAKIQGKK